MIELLQNEQVLTYILGTVGLGLVVVLVILVIMLSRNAQSTNKANIELLSGIIDKTFETSKQQAVSVAREVGLTISRSLQQAVIDRIDKLATSQTSELNQAFESQRRMCVSCPARQAFEKEESKK